MIALIAFYLFATLTIASAVAVIFARNPVHSVLWLILAFFNAAGLMLLVGAEFIAMLLVIVYVGAVAVLFLFVVMMLDIDFASLRSGFTKNLPFGIIIALVLLAEMVLAVSAWSAGPTLSGRLVIERYNLAENDPALRTSDEELKTYFRKVAKLLLPREIAVPVR